jgi:hypothetical protein
MKPSVYIETTIVSYLTAWSSSDPVRRGHQIVTQKWWAERAGAFSLCTSQVVVDEAGMGDAGAAAERLAALAGIPLLELGPEVLSLADELVAGRALPPNARVDAVHLALAAISDVDYLMTWNCKHLANATLRDRIEAVCDRGGVSAPRICTPLELMEVPDGT